MSISFSKSVMSRLQREIPALEAEIQALRKKSKQAETTLKQLQRDSKKSDSPTDLNNKLARINRLNKEMAEYVKKQSELTKELAAKKSALAKYLTQPPS